MPAFCGYHMGDYFKHYLSIEKLAKVPAVFHVNWFCKGPDGRFLCPGYGENARVLAWIIGRVLNNAHGVESPLGIIPTYADLDWIGSDFTEEQFNAVIAIDLVKIKIKIKVKAQAQAQAQAETNTECLNTIGKSTGPTEPELLAVSNDIIARCQ
jgi:phosphoenolpyruvate carboxykinase (GTP)